MNPSFLKKINEHYILKLFTGFGIIVFLMSISFIIFFIYSHSKSLTNTMISNCKFNVQILAYNSRIGVFSENEDLLKYPVESILQQEEVLAVLIYNTKGEILKKQDRYRKVDNHGSLNRDDFYDAEIFKRFKESVSPFHIEEKDRYQFWAPVLTIPAYSIHDIPGFAEIPPKKDGNIIGFAMIAVSKQMLNKQLDHLLFIGVLIGILYLAVASIASYYMARGILKPLNRLIESVKVFGKGGVVQSVPVETRDEIGKLAIAFNNMAESLMKREQSLKESEERFRLIAENIREVFYITDPQKTQCLYVSPAYEEIWGLTRESLYERFESLMESIHPEDRDHMVGSFEKQRRGESTEIEYRIIRPDGSLRWIRSRAYPVKEKLGKSYLIVGIAEDITVHKKAEETLRKSENELRLVAENVPALFSYLDTNGFYRFVNKQYEEWFGIPRNDIIGKHYNDILGEDASEAIREHFNKTLTGQNVKFEGLLPYKHAGTRWVSIRYVPNFDIHGMVNGLFALITDITAQKTTENALKQANEKMLEAFNQRKILSKRLIDLLEKDRHQIAMELHDHIGQILTSLKINLEMMQEELKSDQSILKSRIRISQERTLQALKDIKNISRGLKPSILDSLGLISSLQEMFNNVESDSDITIRFFNNYIPKRLEQEKELAIYRIIQEALNNIIKHARAQKVFINLVKKDDIISLSVEDDGVGFDKKKVMKITSGKGPLGLLIMQERAVQLNGQFFIESDIGKGTHLMVEIPI